MLAVASFAQGVKFETGTWEEMLNKAKTESKLVFVDVYTQWCGPCKHVATNVFPQEKLGEVYNKQFINFQIDAESPAGKEFVTQYPVDAYPTFFYINSQGEILNKAVGAKSVDGFIREASMVETFARYGGYAKMMEAIENGTATKEMYKEYYLSANDKEKPKAVNLYLKSMSLEELMDVDNKVLEEISLYDKELMIRLIDEIIKVGNSKRFQTDKDFVAKFNFNIGFPVQYDISTFLSQSIKAGNLDWLNELLELKERFMSYKLSKQNGDWQVMHGRGLFFATPTYIRLSYMAKNRVEEEAFKAMWVSYIDSLMREVPVDSVICEHRNVMVNYLKENGLKNGFGQSALEKGEVTASNIIDWTDYYWKISPSTKKVKNQCLGWINYAYYANPYNSKVALKAADLLARIGDFKTAETVLEIAIQKQKDIKQPNRKVFRPLELKLRDVQNGKL